MTTKRRKKTAKRENTSSRESAEIKLNLALGRWQRRWLLPLVPEERLLDPLCGDPLGLLYLVELIDEGRYHGGMVFRNIARHYRRIQGLTSGYPKAIGVKGLSNGRYDDPMVAAIIHRYEEARQKVLRRGGEPAMNAVDRICHFEVMIDQEQLRPLRRGLAALAN